MGAVEPLRRRGFELDVRGCRQMSEGLRVLGARARAGSLPKQVAIGLGTNWTVTLGQIRRALRTVGREQVLGLVTPREVGGAASTDQEAIRAAGLRWPRRVIDWVDHSTGHRDWFWSDGLHLTARGARALARLMSRSLGTSSPAPQPPPAPPPGGGVPAPPPPPSAGSARDDVRMITDAARAARSCSGGRRPPGAHAAHGRRPASCRDSGPPA